jgi:hypothetical protein
MAGEAVRPLHVAELPDEIDITNCDATAAGLLAAVSAPGLVIADLAVRPGTSVARSARRARLPELRGVP